jgi:formate hydrogenlyase subunit 3/multisubunit Na+/H+ antiporter MnhD subunit
MHPVARKSQVSLHVFRSDAATFVALGQWGFALGIAIAVSLHPGFVLNANEGGISDYGVHLKTALPYDLALACAALGSYVAARHARDSAKLPPNLRTVLLTYAGLVALTLATTFGYTLDRPQRDLHVIVGTVLTVVEVVASWWMYRERRGDLWLALVQLVGFVLGALTITGLIHLLFVSEMMTGASFALLLYRSTRQQRSPTR